MIYNFVNSFVKIFLLIFQAFRRYLCSFNIIYGCVFAIIPIITGTKWKQQPIYIFPHSQIAKK